jgi:hypothetical protein
MTIRPTIGQAIRGVIVGIAFRSIDRMILWIGRQFFFPFRKPIKGREDRPDVKPRFLDRFKVASSPARFNSQRPAIITNRIVRRSKLSPTSPHPQDIPTNGANQTGLPEEGGESNPRPECL